MDIGNKNPPTSGQSQREHISNTASAMINASDMITPEAYQANLQRIQEIKEIVRKLEVNNDVAHRNFLVDQLERRAMDGREAEVMLTRLRNQMPPPETVRLTNNIPSGNSEVILPTTATLVEVPETYSSSTVLHFSPAATSFTSSSQTVQQTRPAGHHQSHPPQLQPYHPDVFRHYVPPPQHSTMPYGHPLQSTVYNQPAQTVFQPIQPQQLQSTGSHPPRVAALPVPGVVSGYHVPPARWTNQAPTYGGPTAFPSNETPNTAPHPINPNMYPSNVASRAQVPLSGVATMLPTTPLSQVPRSYPQLTDSQPRPISMADSKTATISENQRPADPPPQPTQLKQVQLQEQQPRSQRPPLPSQQHRQQSQIQPLSQQPSQAPQTHYQAPLPVVDGAHSINSAQGQGQPSQPPQLRTTQGQLRQGPVKFVDQATFVKLFQSAAERGVLQLKAFWIQAKAFGISDEWLRLAVDSLPRNVRQSFVAQGNQSGPAQDHPLPSDTQVAIPTPNVPLAETQPTAAAIPPVPIAPAVQQASNSSISPGKNTASKSTFDPYVAQLQYYSDQATLAAHPSYPGGTIPSTQDAPATPTRDVLHDTANVRTPKDANKSTLARDVLRALGKTTEKSREEAGSESAGKNINHEANQLPVVVPSQPAAILTSEEPTANPVSTGSVEAHSPSDPSPSATSEAQVGPKLNVPSSQSIGNAISEEQREPAGIVEGSIMIDLTLEDSDESIDGKGHEPTFPIKSCVGAAVSSQPTSLTNTTSHTPLFESLSLEERPVNAVECSDNTDVRMNSPPLSLSAEENIDSELPYPPPGNGEPILPTIEPLPDELSERPLSDHLPLFLPSPPASPASTKPATSHEAVDDGGEGILSIKRGSAEVDKTEVDTEMAILRKRRRQQVYVLIPPAPPYVKKAKMKERAMTGNIESEVEGVGEDEELRYSHLERLLIEESKLRLLERRCRWSNCGATLNCAANLLAHLKTHACDALQAPSACHWANCQRQFSTEDERDTHLEKHTIRPLPCPFAGCDERFDKPVEVMQHEVEHQKADCRELPPYKPTYQPIVPAIPARLGPPPQRLPSHRVIPRRVAKCQISADRHAIVGPWVLWNIFSPVDLNMRKQNASMRGRPVRHASNYDTDDSDARRDEYDFLSALSNYPAKDPQLDDLDSTLITMSAARGLTLWGSGATEDGHANEMASGGNVGGQTEENAVERTLTA